MEIYANPPVDSIDEFQVPVFTKGSKAYNDITEIPELNVYPWNAKKVYGEINYPFGNLSPSRTAFVNDEWLGAFIKTMLGVTKQLGEFVDRLEAWKRAKQRSKFNQIFQETWQKIFKNLSPEWMQKGTGPNDKRPNPPPPPPPPIGPIYRVEVTPENARVAFRTVESLTARPYDKFGNIVRDSSLIYYWKLDERRLGQLTDDVKKTARFQAFNKEGITTLAVTVLQYIEDKGEEKTIKKTTATNIWVVKDLPLTPPPSPPSGDRPPNREETNLSEDGPHSKYDLEMKTVYINDHHSDYIKANQNSEETLNRYINYCYATEIAVNRWKNLDPHDLSEKITELVSLAERTFDWKELLRKPKGRHRKEDENA